VLKFDTVIVEAITRNEVRRRRESISILFADLIPKCEKIDIFKLIHNFAKSQITKSFFLVNIFYYSLYYQLILRKDY